MEWCDEPWVKLYQRDTADDLALSWQARAVWHEMLKKFDRSGLVESKRGCRGLAALIRLPLDVVEPAIAELLEDGRITQTPAGYFAPNFIEAQKARKSDRLRQEESRARRKARNTLSSPQLVTERDEAITNRDRSSRVRSESEQTVTDQIRSDQTRRDESVARAIPGVGAQNSTTEPVATGLPKANHDAWEYARTRYDEIGKLGPEDNPRPGVWTALPTGSGAQLLVERTREIAARSSPPDWPAVAETHRNVVECNVERARLLGHRGFLVPTRIYEHDSFHRYVDVTPAQVRAIESAKHRSLAHGARAGPHSATDEPTPLKPLYRDVK